MFTEHGILDGDYLSPLEASRVLECSADNVRTLARGGRLRVAIFTRSGRLFRREDVDRLKAERASKSTGGAPDYQEREP